MMRIWWFVITFLFTKSPQPENSKGTFRSSSQTNTCPRNYHTRWRLLTVFLLLIVKQRNSFEYYINLLHNFNWFGMFQVHFCAGFRACWNTTPLWPHGWSHCTRKWRRHLHQLVSGLLYLTGGLICDWDYALLNGVLSTTFTIILCLRKRVLRTRVKMTIFRVKSFSILINNTSSSALYAELRSFGFFLVFNGVSSNVCEP